MMKRCILAVAFVLLASQAFSQDSQGTSPLSIVKGGTAASTASGARTNLGLGTMATQSAGAVAITGGTITGLGSPSNASDVAIKSYVDSVSSGLNILAPSTLATAAVLPNSPTYSNGASGVGATLTAGSNSTLTVDGIVAALNDIVLVKNQASALQNGVYKLTTAGSGAAAWVLTRATYFDQAAEMKAGSYTFISTGSTNASSSWTLQTAITTVGTDSLSFVQFSGGSAVSSFNSRTGAITPALGDYGVSTGGTGIGNMLGYVSGIQPAKLASGVIAINPGTWANNTGTKLFNSTSVLQADLTTSTINFGVTPPTGGQVSGALSTGSTYDGTEIMLYLGHRNSDNKVFLFTSSSDTQSSSQSVSCTNASPSVLTFGSPHGLRKRMAIYMSGSCGPFGSGVRYYVCTVPSSTTATLTTSIPNVNSSTCSGGGSNGSTTASWGVQPDLDFGAGAGILTMDRRHPYWAGMWKQGWDYIPYFTMAQGESTTLLTGMDETTNFCTGNLNPGGSYVARALTEFLANLNRQVLFHFICVGGGSGGTCFARATSSFGNQIVGTAGVSQSVAQDVWLATDSVNSIDIAAGGTANINICVKGWRFMDPS